MKVLRSIWVLLIALSLCGWHPSTEQATARTLVMGSSSAQTAFLVQSVQGTVERELAIIDGVEANLTPRQIALLQAQGLTVAANSVLQSAGVQSAPVPHRSSEMAGIGPSEALNFSKRDLSRYTGEGVTVAIVDSGLTLDDDVRNHRNKSNQKDTIEIRDRNDRFLVYRDFIGSTRKSKDVYGHGTHIAGIIAGSVDGRQRDLDEWRGVAPNANLVVARAIGEDGSGTYADTIAAIDWIVANKKRYNIRVLNLSLFAPVESLYWADPLNRAVMKAWQSGIVVVTAAGNHGADPESVAVPGNNPYVITIGAFRSASLADSGQDELTQWSSRGPTPDSGFVKPDVLAPGVRLVSALPAKSELAQTMADGMVAQRVELELAGAEMQVGMYQLSGTSMAAAEVSGLVALMLEAQPRLTNDQVKWILSRTANLAVNAQTNEAAYSTWEQGFGKINASEALSLRRNVGSANKGMDIARDLDTSPNGQHYVGLTSYDPATGLYSLPASGNTTGTYFNWCGQFTSWPGSAALGDCASGGTTTPSAGSTWTGAGSTWTGAGSTWTGAGSTWTGAGSTWGGAGSTWTGAGSTWTGAGSTWTGAGSTWTGAGSTWTGAGSTWTGAGSIWTGLAGPWDGED